MYYPHTINEKTITVIVDGKPRTISASNANFTKVKALLISGRHEEILPLLDVRKSIEKMGGGDITIVGNSVLYQGRKVPNYQAQKLISMYRDGHKNIQPYKNFITRLAQNPSFRAQEEFAKFADVKELPITEEGFVIAWKGVGDNHYSIMGNTSTRVLKGKVDSGGHIFNGVGEEIEIDRRDVCDDARIGCAQGIHAGSRAYACGWGKILKLVKFDPADVISVPFDCNCAKIRLSKYWVIGEELKEKESLTEAVLSESGKSRKSAKQNTHTRKEYLAEFRKIISTMGLSFKDAKVIAFEMEEIGFYDEDEINGLLLRFEIAEKINRYIDRQGGEVSYKKIQSAMKSYRLLYSDIESILEDLGDLA